MSQESTPNTNNNINSNEDHSETFFADATLDLDEAHDIAETPEAVRPVFNQRVTLEHHQQLRMPSLDTVTEEMAPRRRNNSLEMVTPSSNTNNNNTLRGDKENFSRITSVQTQENNLHVPKSVPRWPRDIYWGMAFVVTVPIAILWPIFIQQHQHASRLTRPPLSTATIHALVWAGVATFLLSRIMYRSAAGGEGENDRHHVAQLLTFAVPVSVLVYTVLAITIWWACAQFRIATVIPLWYLVRDIYLFRKFKRSTQGSTSRHAFFQALVDMALDVLARSLRRASFFRVLTGILGTQLCVLLLWRWALLGALGTGSWGVLLVAAVGGKWATGAVARLLSLVASGGVMSWFLQQSMLVQNLPQLETDDTTADAYRTVDASVYQTVLDMDDALDDDYEMDDDELLEAPSPQQYARRTESLSTVKSLLTIGLTVSFGSVVQCGLLGGLAQFIWSQLRKIDVARNVIAQTRDETGFRGMQIGSNDTSIISKIWIQINQVARTFVRNHSDLAMTHVAVYYKGYQRAARDVAHLVEQSGVEPILHEDISTHICACIGGSISGIIVIFTGFVLLRQRNGADEPVSDVQVVENMLLAFVLCYTLIFTVMEPLRASIKATYVAFAQNPRSLSQAFPLIYHRLTRLSEPSTS